MTRKRLEMKNPSWLCEKDSGIGTDDSFERPYGCWGKKQKEEFIISVMGDNVSTPFVVAEVSRCEDYCEELGSASGKKWFADEKAKGYKYISIDGKHRRETICDFMNDMFAVSGEFQNQQGTKYEIVKKKYSELDEALKAQFDNCELIFTILTKHTRDQLSKEFIRINSAEALTKQHLRMAEDSVMSRWIRAQAALYSGLISPYKPKAVARCKPHENMSKIFLHCESESGSVNTEALNALYHRGLEEGQSGCMSKAYPITIIKMAQEVYEILESLGIGINETILYTLVVKRLVENSYKITNYETFKMTIKNLDGRLKDDSYGAYNKKRRSRPSEKDFYFHWKTQNWNSPTRAKRADALWSEIMNNPASYAVDLMNVKEEAA